MKEIELSEKHLKNNQHVCSSLILGGSYTSKSVQNCQYDRRKQVCPFPPRQECFWQQVRFYIVLK